MLPTKMLVKEGLSVFGLHLSGVPEASWLASTYPACADQQSLGTGQASVMHRLPKHEGQLACPKAEPAWQPLRGAHGPWAGPPKQCPGEGILMVTNGALRAPNL